jgi:hypothetical protein
MNGRYEWYKYWLKQSAGGRDDKPFGTKANITLLTVAGAPGLKLGRQQIGERH